jgi:hypothetical protein
MSLPTPADPNFAAGTVSRCQGGAGARMLLVLLLAVCPR